MFHVRRAIRRTVRSGTFPEAFRSRLLAGAAAGALLVGAATLGSIAAPSGALAQMSPVIDSGDTGVMVDLSVLEDRGIGGDSPGAPVPPLLGGRRGLLMPGGTPPRSQFLAGPANGATAAAPKLKQPARAAATARQSPQPEPVIVTAEPAPLRPAVAAAKKAPSAPPPPAPAPKPIQQAAAAPAPVTAPPPPAPPKMAQAPAKPAAAPKAPKPPAAPMVRTAPPPPKSPAPMVAKAPPPPPVKMDTPAKAAAVAPPPPAKVLEPAPIAPPAAPVAAPVVAKAPPPPPPPAVVPATQVTVPLPQAAKAAPETAARPPAGGSAAGAKAGETLQVEFPADDAKLPASAQAGLSALAARLASEKDLRLQLKAYAGGGDMTANKARRLSLSRALSVRSYLIEKGVRSTRIDVRALGNKTTDAPVNRVDLDVIER